MFLVVEGEPDVPIEGIVDHALMFSPDSRRLAYAAAKPDRRSYPVVDGKAGPVHDGIGGSIPSGVTPNQASTQSSYMLGSGSSFSRISFSNLSKSGLSPLVTFIV